MNLPTFEKFQRTRLRAPEARKNVAQRVSAGYSRVKETSPRGAKDRPTFVLRPSGAYFVFTAKPSAYALGYILSRLWRWSLVVFATLLFPILLLGQQRPLLTEDPRITSPGSVTSELGFAYLDRARFPVSGLGGNELQFLVNGLHFGLGDRSEFQITGVAHNFLWVHENGTGRRNDWGDFSLSTKIKLVDEKGARPIISFRPTVVLPNSNNDKGLGTDGTHFFGSLLFGKTVEGRIFLFGNVGLGILDDALRAAAQQDVLAYGIAAIVPIGQCFRVAAEVNGWDNAQTYPSPGGEDRSQARLGFQVGAAGVRWDIAATAGLTRWDHRAGVVFGMTKEFRLWK